MRSLHHLAAVSALLLVAACAPQRSAPPGGGDPVPDELQVAGGWYFGECWGDCQGRVEVDTETGWASFTALGWDGTIYMESGGLLSEDWLDQLRDEWDTINPAVLQETYGCPDCADGGGEYIELGADDGPERSDYEYAEPPTELAGIHALLRQVEDDLRWCFGGAAVQNVEQCDGDVPTPGDGGDEGDEGDDAGNETEEDDGDEG